MADVATNNPAGRLHRLLSSVKSYNPTNTQLWQVWGYVLGINPPDAGSVFGQISLVANLPDQIESEIRRTPFGPDGFLSHLSPVKSFLTDVSILSHQLATVVDRIPVDSMAQLEAVSSLLSGYNPNEDRINETTIEGIRGDVVTLLDDIGHMDGVNDELRLFLADHLHDMLHGLDSFAILGSDALRRLVDEAWGAIDVQKPHVASEADEAARGRFWELVQRVAAVVALVATPYSLFASINAGDLPSSPPAIHAPKFVLPPGAKVLPPKKPSELPAGESSR